MKAASPKMQPKYSSRCRGYVVFAHTGWKSQPWMTLARVLITGSTYSGGASTQGRTRHQTRHSSQFPPRPGDITSQQRFRAAEIRVKGCQSARQLAEGGSRCVNSADTCAHKQMECGGVTGTISKQFARTNN